MPRLVPSTTPQNKLVLASAQWAAIQLILLSLSAGQVRLWAHHPFPPESLASFEMGCGQIVFFAMLFPVFASSRWALISNILMTFPFAELAGLLSSTPQLQIVKGDCCIVLWLLGLGLCTVAFKPAFFRSIAALAVFFTAGGAVFDYLRWETYLSVGDTNAMFHPATLLPSLIGQNWRLAIPESAFPLLVALITGCCRLILRQFPLSSTETKIG